MLDVLIRGDGVAACCCAHLLQNAGFEVAVERVERPRLPVIMVGEQALALIRDVFEKPNFLHGLPRITRRVVAWGANAKPFTVDHSAVAVSEEDLLKTLRPSLSGTDLPAKARWTIFAARPLPPSSVEHCFGTRMASAVPVALKHGSDPSACWIESLENGWLFLLPNAPAAGWLLAVGGAAEALLECSRLIASVIARLGSPSGPFPAYARIMSPLCTEDWLACGTAAIAFDPICGDGTAHAVREAILAAAIVRALSKGGTARGLLSHYERRVTAGFQRHLTLCRGFYQSGGTTPLWLSELDSIDRGIRWCNARLNTDAEFRYQLRGFELEAVR